MNIDRTAPWVVRERALPVIVKPCLDCSGTHHRPSGRFRLSANSNALDVWLLLGCEGCGRISKVPVYHERVHVRPLERARRLAYENNDSPDDPAPLKVLLVNFELPVPLRVERLLILGLG